MSIATVGPFFGMAGGLMLLGLILRVIAPRQPKVKWSLLVIATGLIVGPMAPLLAGRVSESARISISLFSIGCSVIGMIGAAFLIFRSRS